jgi:GT2 family glycosyltransferase
MTTHHDVSGPMGVSVVLPCYNRAAYLDQWLAAFAWWDTADLRYEILIVDDGGADHAAAIAERWGERGLNVRYLRVRAPGGPRNNAQARNAGIRAACHPLVLNSDPDVVFVTDVMRQLVSQWTPGTFCSLTGYFPLTQEEWKALTRLREMRPLTPEDFLVRVRRRHNLVHRPDGVYGLHGAFLCDRETLAAIRGYDERFVLWGWEDRDLLTRLERGLGFARRYVDGASVVHQWHPTLRGDEGAPRTRVLWQMGWQQACATMIGPIQRNPERWGEHVPEAAEASRASVPDTTGCSDGPSSSWMQLFAAYLYEAGAWLREGHAAVAMGRLRLALTRWWEQSPELADTETASPVLQESEIAAAHDAGYAHVLDVVMLYAISARAAGDHPAAEEALLAARRLPGAAAAVSRVRAAWLAEERRWEDAIPLLLASIHAEPRPDALALLVEGLLQRDRVDEARTWIDMALAGDLDTFERLHFEGYRAYVVARNADGVYGEPWPPQVAAASAGEFLFSVAMRARRQGLTVGATVMLEAYLAAPPEDDALRGRARLLLDEVRLAC